MEFCILGTLELRDADRSLPLGAPMQRMLLAHLLLAGGRPVAAAELVDRLWQGAPPARGRNSLQVHVLRLRRTFFSAGCAARIETSSGTYRLDLRGDTLDADRFERLVGEAATAHDPDTRAASLGSALALWRAPVMDGIEGDWPRFPEVRRLIELRAEAVEQAAVDRLACGRPDAAATALHMLVAEHPGRERLRYLLTMALYRAGRRAEALAAYDDAYRFAVEHLGLEPGADLQRLQRAILRGEPAMHRAAPARTAQPAAQPGSPGICVCGGRPAASLEPAATREPAVTREPKVAAEPGVAWEPAIRRVPSHSHRGSGYVMS